MTTDDSFGCVAPEVGVIYRSAIADILDIDTSSIVTHMLDKKAAGVWAKNFKVTIAAGAAISST